MQKRELWGGESLHSYTEDFPYYLLKPKAELIELLGQRGITDQNVLKAFEKVDRHRFVEGVDEARAYQDIALPIRCNQTISRPFTVAMQSQLLEVKKKDKILEIGTGSGFQAAILDAMDADVYSIERHHELYRFTKKLLDDIAPSIALYSSDGFKGLPQKAPFNKIIVTCGALSIPLPLFKQLKIGGIMVIPIGESTQTMVKIVKIDETKYEKKEYGEFTFVPMLENIKKEQ